MLLLELAIRGVLLLALVGVAALALRRRSSGFLCLLWSSAVVGLLALPLLAGLVPSWELPLQSPWIGALIVDGSGSAPAAAGEDGVAPSPGDAAAVRDHSAADAEDSGGAATVTATPAPTGPPAVGTASVAPSPGAPRVATILVAAWVAGATVLLLRTLAGLLRGARIVAAAEPVADPVLEARVRRLAARLGVAGGVQVRQTPALRVPVIWHLARPCLLIPPDLSTWPEGHQESVLIHELAHVRRHDCRVGVLARVAVALHWFNPLAWLALSEIRTHRERACDDAVLRAGVRASSYARHLLSLARSLQDGPTAWAGSVALLRDGGLSPRVRAILEPRTGRTSPNRRTVVTSLALTLTLLLPVAAIQPVAASLPGSPAASPQEAPSPRTPVTDEAFEPGTVIEKPSPAAGPVVPVVAAPAPTQEAEPELDELVRMRIHDVTPEFIDAMARTLGRRPAVDELVELRIHDVSPEFIAAMSDVLGERLDAEAAVRLSIHDATVDYAREMRDAFGDGLGVAELVKGRIHDVSPADAAELGALLGSSLDFEDVVRFQIQGVDPEFVRGLQELIPPEELDAGSLVKMRIHDVTPELVRALRDAGYHDLTAEELVRIQIHDMAEMMLRRDGGEG